MTEDQAVAETAKTIDGHRLAEFVYGTVTGMVALSGMSSGPDATWTGSIAIVLAGAVAIWLAHGYSIMLSKRVTAGHRLSGSEIASVFAGSWPIVIAGAVLAAPFVLVGVGILTLALAIDVAGLVGVALLALVGILAGVLTNETWSRRILLALVSAGMGILVVAVEFVVHH